MSPEGAGETLARVRAEQAAQYPHPYQPDCWEYNRAEAMAFDIEGPKVGDHMTESMYSDAHSYTVLTVNKTGTRITLQRDRAKLLNGANSGEPDALQFAPGGFAGRTTGKQRWETVPDPDGNIRKAYLNKQGRWRMSGSTGTGCGFLHAGSNERYDHNF